MPLGEKKKEASMNLRDLSAGEKNGLNVWEKGELSFERKREE